MSLYHGKALGQLQITPLISQLLSMVRRHHLLLPREMAMILKMLLMTEGMGARLDPEFSLAEVLKPFAARLSMERFTPRELAKMLSQLGLSVVDAGMTLPETLDTLRQHLDDGFQVHLRAAELEPLVTRAERIGNRLVAGMVISAFIRGLGGMATADSDRLRKWSTPLAAGGVGALSALGAYLAWTGRPRPFSGR
ncbi:MAG: hypothetical protein HIU81_07165 [Acidobacteria bacterium]|nr:hypothetical protein [Acidobacteriota bacterium]